MIAGGDAATEWNLRDGHGDARDAAAGAGRGAHAALVRARAWSRRRNEEPWRKSICATSSKTLRQQASQVIHGIDMEIADGEFIVIVGPSGCGKSTLLRMVAGLEDDHRRRDRDRRPRRQRARAQGPRHRDGVPELRALPAHERVRQHGLRPEDPRHAARTRSTRACDKAAEILELGQLLDRKPRQLSGGQRQRVAMGRAIVREPAGVPVRRAALQPRRQAARADAARDPEAAARARHHLALRHARPGRGDDAGRPA